MADQQLDLATWITEMEAERAKLDLMIATARARLGLQPSEAGASSPLAALTGLPNVQQTGRVRQDEFFRMAIPDAIKKYLNIMKQPQSPKAIEEGLKAGGLLTNSKNFYATISTALKRLRDSDQIVNTANGWGLSEWYPSKPKTPEEAKSRGKKTRRKVAKPTTNEGVATPGKPSPYRDFMAAQMKTGKTMSEAAAAWRKQHEETAVATNVKISLA